VTGVSELAERTRSALRAVDGARQALTDSHTVLSGIVDRLTPLLADSTDPAARQVLDRYVRARDAVAAQLAAVDTAVAVGDT
jgi:hypothetical protein